MKKLQTYLLFFLVSAVCFQPLQAQELFKKIINTFNKTALHEALREAVKLQNIDQVKNLLKQGANPNKVPEIFGGGPQALNTVLTFACYRGTEEIG